MVRVGLVGCGTIGSRLARALQRDYPHAARITALHDADPSRAAALQRILSSHPPIVPLAILIRRSDLVIEAASVEAARAVLSQALPKRRSVFIMSVGALLQDQRWRAAPANLYIPSGALAGLDGLKAMAVGTIRRASLTTRKPPRALAAAPYVLRKRLRLVSLRRPKTIFTGSPRQVVSAFPQNTNVAAALALALGVHGSRARVQVVADPTIQRNVHELDVESDCGRLRCRVESRPSRNPKTSELAVRSAVATLRRIFEPVAIGT